MRPLGPDSLQSSRQQELDESIVFPDQKGKNGNQNQDMIRMDLSQNQIPQTPKNQILLMRLTDQLISYLEQAQEAQTKQQEQGNEKSRSHKSPEAKRKESQA